MNDKREEIIKRNMQAIGRKVDNELPAGYGFVVLSFKFNAEPDTSSLMYVSNATREDVVKAMEEFIEKTKSNYGNDAGKY